MMDPQNTPDATAEPAATTPPPRSPKTLRYVLAAVIVLGLAAGVGAILVLDVTAGLMP